MVRVYTAPQQIHMICI